MVDLGRSAARRLNHRLAQPASPKDRERCREISALNQAFRKGDRPELGRIVITTGARLHATSTGLAVESLVERVRAGNDFPDTGDLHHEHDFGMLECAGVLLVWKIEYFDEKLKYASADPSNPHITTRLLTIMLADEY